jgi:hypothetical protein
MDNLSKQEFELLDKFEKLMQLLALRIQLRNTYFSQHIDAINERRELLLERRRLALSDDPFELDTAISFHHERYQKELVYFSQKYKA